MPRSRFAARFGALLPAFLAILAIATIAILLTTPAGLALAMPRNGVTPVRAHPSRPVHTATGVHIMPTLPAWRAKHRIGNTAPQGSGDLLYQGGAVLHDPVSYVIFWGSYWNTGSGLTADAQIVLSYFNDMGTTQYENLLTQYNDTTEPIADTHQLAAYWNDTSTPPTDTTCNSSPTIENSSIATEVTNAIATQGWPTDSTNAVYFVYTPPNDLVGAPWGCSGQQYCAYHTASAVPYAVLPYPNLNVCPAVQSPNGNADGDSLVNLTSHEQFETITDPYICDYGCSRTGWIDVANYEIGDKCAWNFDDGSTSLNNGGVFYVQTEYSNATHTCVNAYDSPPRARLSPASLSLSAEAGTNPAQQQLTLENTTWNTLTWTSDQLPPWVTLNPTSGSVAAGQTQALTLTFTTANLEPATLTAGLILTSNADNSPSSINIIVALTGGTLNTTVLQGPTTPACLIGVPCWTPMAGAQVQIYTSADVYVGIRTTDVNGSFSIPLIPGDYILQPVLTTSPPANYSITPAVVTVPYQQTVSATIVVDSGLR